VVVVAGTSLVVVVVVANAFVVVVAGALVTVRCRCGTIRLAAWRLVDPVDRPAKKAPTPTPPTTTTAKTTRAIRRNARRLIVSTASASLSWSECTKPSPLR
jgi:hypothetical protein